MKLSDSGLMGAVGVGILADLGALGSIIMANPMVTVCLGVIGFICGVVAATASKVMPS